MKINQRTKKNQFEKSRQFVRDDEVASAAAKDVAEGIILETVAEREEESTTEHRVVETTTEIVMTIGMGIALEKTARTSGIEVIDESDIEMDGYCPLEMAREKEEHFKGFQCQTT
mmetsp:Transcript_9636/g.14440  ORF Transcript_9636/g.14440 Transcript_9636/m.14440 type:complete len:115 (+) Transcript_9636:211-555(+)